MLILLRSGKASLPPLQKAAFVPHKSALLAPLRQSASHRRKAFFYNAIRKSSNEFTASAMLAPAIPPHNQSKH
jgi:hypothetical protein